MRLQLPTSDTGSAEDYAKQLYSPRVQIPGTGNSSHPFFFSWAQQDFRPGRRGEHTAEQSRKHLTVMRP